MNELHAHDEAVVHHDPELEERQRQEREMRLNTTVSILDQYAAPTKLFGAYRQFSETTKAVGANSEYFEAINHSMEALIQVEENMHWETAPATVNTAYAMREAYQRVLDAANAYTGRKGIGIFTSTGRARMRIAREIVRLAQLDMARINMVIDQAIEHGGATWRDVMEDARVATVQPGVRELGELQTIGGGSSTNYILPQDGTHPKLYFKPTKTVPYYTPTSQASDMWRTREKKSLLLARGVPAEDVEVLHLQNGSMYAGKRGCSLELWARYADDILAVDKELDKQQQSANQMEIMGSSYQDGEAMDFTRRNEATCRVASLLGSGSVMAKARLVKVRLEGGREIEGSGMEEAPGMEFQSRQAKEQLYGSDKHSRFSPEALKQLIQIQVLDNLCGQVDRNFGNLFVQTDGHGVITSVKAIDHDLSFGLETNFTALSERAPNAPAAFREEGGTVRINLPHIPKAMAESILALQPGTLTFAMRDLLKPEEVQAACTRLTKMQRAIREQLALESEPAFAGRRVFLRDGEWAHLTTADFQAEREDQANLVQKSQRMLDGSFAGDPPWTNQQVMDDVASIERQNRLGEEGRRARIREASQGRIL
jgi:hypothetical protein